MPQFSRFKVAVVVEGEELPEYCTVISESTNIITSWIPSQEGKAFSVKFQSEPYPRALMAKAMADGLKVSSKTFHPCGARQTGIFEKCFTSSTTSRELLFSRKELTDDDTFLGANVQDLGDIVLEIWEGNPGKKILNPTTINKGLDNKVHERSKKALVHQVAFGREIAKEPREVREFFKEKLLATFIFKYRPIDVLRADGIAPPDPAMKKRKADKIVDGENENGNEDDEHELKKLLGQVNRIQERMAKNKVHSTKKIKRELRLLISSEVIDLT